MKKNLFFVLGLLLVFTLAFAVMGFGASEAQPPAEELTGPYFIVVSTGSPGGVYFALGAGIAKVITDKVDDVFAQSESTAASVENCWLVGNKKSEMGMAIASVAYDAYVGQGPFEGDTQSILTLFSMYPAAQHLIVSADSDIYSIQDLIGKRVSVGAPGSGCEVASEIILDVAGILDEVNTVNYSQVEAADALKDGLVDAVFYNLTAPGAIIEEIMFYKSIRFIAPEDELLDAILDDYPYFTKGFIPGGVYRDAPEDVSALTVGNLMVVHEDMSEDMAYNLLNAIFDEASIQELIGIHPVARNFQRDLASQSPVPLHLGAEKFFGDTLPFELDNMMIIGGIGVSIDLLFSNNALAREKINAALDVDGVSFADIVVNFTRSDQLFWLVGRHAPTAGEISSIMDKIIGYWDADGNWVKW